MLINSKIWISAVTALWSMNNCYYMHVMKTQMSTSTCSEHGVQISQGEKKNCHRHYTKSIPLHKTIKNGICSNAQGHWWSAAKAMLMSHHANSICSLSEEHQSLAGIKMRLFKLQQPLMLHVSPLTVQTLAPETPWPPTSLSSNWALCFKAMEITEGEKAGYVNSYIM